MKEKTEQVLIQYANLVERDSNTPEIDTPEMTDEQIEAVGEKDEPITDTYKAAMDLLEAIHAEEPYFQQVARDNRLADRAENEEKADNGLTTEINRSTALVSVTDTMENIVALLKRHPYGYKQGSRDRKGNVVNEPFTAAENLAAEKWLASLNNGSPVVAEEEAD